MHQRGGRHRILITRHYLPPHPSHRSGPARHFLPTPTDNRLK
ncbi:hypothetical protein MTBSS4_130034 [Magnetospirillum sp. SS-4]|nr:hypothetical protein MTBSS4_130034 [Magnetospirillum sp. SS-4]